MRLREAARAAGLPYRTAHKALELGLIEIRSGGGKNTQPIVLDDAEAQRVIQAAALSRRYRLTFTEVLRAQLEGRIEENGEGLQLLPVAEGAA